MNTKHLLKPIPTVIKVKNEETLKTAQRLLEVSREGNSLYISIKRKDLEVLSESVIESSRIFMVG